MGWKCNEANGRGDPTRNDTPESVNETTRGGRRLRETQKSAARYMWREPRELSLDLSRGRRASAADDFVIVFCAERSRVGAPIGKSRR